MVSPAKGTDSIILTDMPTKLNTEIVAAAIAGFEEQKKRLDTQIAELRNLLSPGATDSNTLAPKKRGRMSAAARSRIAAPNGRDGRRPESRLERLHPPHLSAKSRRAEVIETAVRSVRGPVIIRHRSVQIIARLPEPVIPWEVGSHLR